MYVCDIHFTYIFLLNFYQAHSLEDPSECDTRFSFCAVATLKLLGRLDMIDCEKALQYVIKCQNFDGAFGVRENSESHAGQVFCCVGVLKILNGLERIDTELLSWWLSERQVFDPFFTQEI